MKKVAIIGAGASGLLCAIFCARSSLHVEMFEQNSKCAKKILVSGNGRCNIINATYSKEDYFSENPLFVQEVLERFGFHEFEKLTKSIGLLLDIKDDGKVYPLSNEAKSVALTLEESAKNLGVTIHTDTKINDIKELTEKFDAVVVATGSQAAPHLGGNEDGMRFAQEFGHTIIPTYPSLVQLHLNSSIHQKMSGAKINGEVSLFVNNQKEISSRGDILFTNYGVSGFAVLDISHSASVALMQYQYVTLSLNLLPGFNQQQLASHMLNVAKQNPHYTLFDILAAIIPLKIAAALLDYLKLMHGEKASELDMKKAKKIAHTMLQWKFEVSDTHGFRHAEVSGGGVSLDEIDSKTMESKKQKNLYFCGEVLDVVGKRGGYNFAFAWASGYTAAQSIIQKL